MLIPGAATAGGWVLGSHPQPAQLPTWWGRRSPRQASLRVTAQPPSAPHPPTAITRLLRTKVTGGGGGNVEAPTRQDRAGTECVPAHLG